MAESTSIIVAKEGELVALITPEYDVVNEGTALRVSQAVPVKKTYNRKGVLARKLEIEAELAMIEIVLGEMDSKGVE